MSTEVAVQTTPESPREGLPEQLTARLKALPEGFSVYVVATPAMRLLAQYLLRMVNQQDGRARKPRILVVATKLDLERLRATADPIILGPDFVAGARYDLVAAARAEAARSTRRA